jgi:hypothetical protein
MECAEDHEIDPTCDQFAATKRVYHHGHSSVEITNLNGVKYCVFVGPRAADHGVCTDNLNAGVAVMKSAQDGA